MAWHDDDGWLTKSLGPYLSTILITAAVAILLPVLLHFILYRTAKPSRLPSFLILGPSGAGKTSLAVQVRTTASTPLRRTPSNPPQLSTSQCAATHTSQAPLTIEAHLPARSPPHSARYRSQHDHETRAPKPVLFTDTPGHGKLRGTALAALADARAPPAGLIFVVDAAALSAAAGGLADAARYLHDALRAAQRGRRGVKAGALPVLVAANKQDLFTALPAPLVRAALEAEIGRLRESRARGLAAVGTVGKGEGLGDGDGDAAEGEDDEPLGGEAGGKFDFGVMEEYGIHVQIIGGSVKSEDGAADGDGHGLDAWWDWVAAQL